MAEESAQEKTEDPTPKRLEKALEDGQVLTSKELFVFSTLFTGFLMYFLILMFSDRILGEFKGFFSFDLSDFHDQLEQMAGMGGLGGLIDKLPGISQLPQNVRDQVNDKDMDRMLAIIRSMTLKERAFPDIIKGSRRRRIAAGSGTQVQDVNRLLKQFTQMQKMMKKMSGKGGMQKMMRGMKGMVPPGMKFPGR